MNTFGQTLTLTTFGESHGPAIGGIIDGLPAGIAVDRQLVGVFMARRRPGGSELVSGRAEQDRVEILSGVSDDGRSLGTPIGFIIPNTDSRPRDYDALKDVFRPNHADFTYQMKYGLRAHRGGGRASARETAVRVAAAAIVYPLLLKEGITVGARLETVGGRPASEAAEVIKAAREAGDSVGGTVSCTITGLPPGIGEPIFDKLQARLAYAMLGIPAVKGFEYGDGFAASAMHGSEHADIFTREDGRIVTRTNHSGGIQGGISNGMPVTMRVAFKPTPSIAQPLETVDKEGNPTTVMTEGRHDPCVALRGVPVVQAMAILTVADLLLQQRKQH